jgi:hypothetical protein
MWGGCIAKMQPPHTSLSGSACLAFWMSTLLDGSPNDGVCRVMNDIRPLLPALRRWFRTPHGSSHSTAAAGSPVRRSSRPQAAQRRRDTSDLLGVNDIGNVEHDHGRTSSDFNHHRARSPSGQQLLRGADLGRCTNVRSGNTSGTQIGTFQSLREQCTEDGGENCIDRRIGDRSTQSDFARWSGGPWPVEPSAR